MNQRCRTSIQNDRGFIELADFLPEIVFVTNENGHVTFVNKAGRSHFGLSDASNGTDILPEIFFIPDDRDRLVKKINGNPEEHEREYTALTVKGDTFPVCLHLRPMMVDDVFTGCIVLLTDRSERKAIQDSLVKKEQQIHDIFKNMWDYWFLCDFEGNFLESNVTHMQEFNISQNELAGLNIMDFLDDDLRDIMIRNFREVIEKGTSRGIEHVRLKDGQEYSFEFNKVLVYEGDRPVAIRILTRDVTEEHQAKKALEINEARYRSVFEYTGLPTVILNDDLIISMVNAKFEDLSGCTKDDIEGKLSLSMFIPKEDWEHTLNGLKAPSGVSSFELECRVTNTREEVYDMILQVGHISKSHQTIVSFTDITSRKQAESDLKESSAQLCEENKLLRTSMKERFRFGNIIGKSLLMQETYESIVNAAETHANVVIYGESGTGKELVAREIHQLSRRKDKKFITVNCGAIPENIMESEFFGYKKGAFTGAYADKPGYLDVADGGTLFLDEVGEINPAMQVKLLRIIDSGDYLPLGSSVSKKTNVRIIAATNRDLRKSIDEGLIREDFFYRVHIIPIHLPPLRERKEDIPILIDHFMKMHGGPQQHPGRILIDQFLGYDWPGNVRELQNVVHRYISMKKLDFKGSARTPQPSVPAPLSGNDDAGLADLLDAYEKELITKTLVKYQWHRGRAAEALGINRKTLFTKVSKHGLNRPYVGVK